MFRKTLIATAAAGMLAAGSLIAGTGTAAASGYVSGSIHFGGPGFSLHFGTPGYYPYHHKQLCKPIVKKVKYWKKGKARWKNVVVGHNCHRHYPKVVYPHPWGPYWGPAW